MHSIKTFSSRLSIFQKLILSIIFLSTIVIVVFTIYILSIPSPSQKIEAEVTSLSTEYYETYFFPSLIDSIEASSDKPIAEVLSPYTETGFTRTPLRQILSHTTATPATIELITKYCDTSNTFVQYFPTAPFDTTSYTTKFTYSCNF